MLFLAGLLAPGDAELAREVVLAHDDPAAYVKAHGAQLSERGMDAPEPNLTVIALSDALLERRRLFIVDHRSTAADVASGLHGVLTTLGLDAARLLRWYDEDDWITVDAAVFLGRCGSNLAAFGHALVHLDIGSDGWEATVIPFDELARAVELGKALGLGASGRVTSLSPKKRPPKEPKPAPARPPKIHETFVLPEGDSGAEGKGDAPMLWVTRPPDRRVLELDVSTWPPTLHEMLHTERFAHLLATSSSGARVVSTAALDGEALGRGESVMVGQLVLLRPGEPTVDLLPRLVPGVDVSHVGFVGDAVVVLPTEPAFRGRRVVRPLLWEGGAAFVAPEELPEVQVAPFGPDNFPLFVRQGFARTGNGDDVLIWEGRGWVRERGRFVARYELGELDAGMNIPTAPGAGDAFFLLHLGRLREARRDAAPIAHLPGETSLHDLAPGPGGTLVATTLRHGAPRSPIAVVYEPAAGKRVDVPAHVLGVRLDDTLRAVRYAAATDRLVGLYGREVRAVPWALASGP